ncbi:Wzz/FepE/Etk N-terminal domain-containing protein [Kitasatospora cathayae]|uniref:Wzz/FepE/Etk N-terminal domain-containing protein n=1 Tax=Kitasatospora cathayae TaxID=3004092 RepID=A0ABY7PYL6_9ACTN|nr:Wzz/FepE/Etk N-terminal domain-containing protein [Kitasatospora sp. HUAS 3-15]WBP85469.1 Wzz/FepE/Etk N-terminal domain-containing protein [Kitasatospora sp. HUAS 3-15]
MSDDTIRLVTIGRILRRRWRLLAVLAAVGALVGYGTSLLFPPSYTASASVLLPGVWQDRELLTQAEIATSSVVVDRAAATLGWNGVSGSELRDQVSATAADGNIIKISGTADTPERAQQLSDQVAQQFVTFAGRIAGDSTDPEAAQPEALRQLVVQASRRITDLAAAADPGQTVDSVQTRTDLEKLRTTLQDAIKKLDQIDPAANRSNMVVMGSATRPSGQAPPTRIQLIAAGALSFFLIAVVGHLVAARRSRRPRTGAEIAAALGSALLGTVDVPRGPRAHRPAGRGPRALLRRLLGTDVRWDLPAPQPSGDEADRRLRYRRVCARLRDRLPDPSRLLVVVPDGDEPGRRAAGQLVDEAGSDPLLRVVEVAVSRPLLPDRDDESGALLVLSAGGWTAEELAGIADACADAGHELVGVVVAGPVRERPTRSEGRRPDDAEPALADDATPALAVGDDGGRGSG